MSPARKTPISEDPKIIQQVKDTLEKNAGREFTWEEAVDTTHQLEQFANIAFEVAKNKIDRDQKLKEFPKGYHLEEKGYSCSICSNSASGEQSWYDKYGLKCMVCQNAINRKEIPPTVATNKDSWYSRFDIDRCFNVKGPVLKNWIKAGILKERTITNDRGKLHLQLFLINDNKDTLPPKKLVQGQMVKEVIDGKEWYTIKPWYAFVDPHKHLEKYKIMNYLKVVQNPAD